MGLERDEAGAQETSRGVGLKIIFSIAHAFTRLEIIMNVRTYVVGIFVPTPETDVGNAFEPLFEEVDKVVEGDAVAPREARHVDGPLLQVQPPLRGVLGHRVADKAGTLNIFTALLA